MGSLLRLRGFPVWSRESLERRDLAAGLAAALLALLLVAWGPLAPTLSGLSGDLLHAARHAIRSAAPGAPSVAPPVAPPVAIVAIDEETYRREPFRGAPQPLWTPQLAVVLEALLDGGAQVVGLNAVLASSADRYIPGHDRPLLLALRRAARDGRIVLGKVQHGEAPIAPHPAYAFAVGAGNIHAVNLIEDPDGVIRRVPLSLPTAEGGIEDGFAAALARRAGHAAAWRAGERLAVDFGSGPRDVPAYSFADLHACAAAGQQAFFTRHFAGRVVLIGAVLDVEDRRRTAMRLLPGPMPAGSEPGAARCLLPPMAGLSRPDLDRSTVPAIYVHAHAVTTLLRDAPLRSLGPAGEAMAAGAGAVLGTLLALALPAGAAALGLLLFGLGWAAVAVAAMGSGAGGLALPLLGPPAAAALTLAPLLGYRFAVTDRARRRMRQAFALYLPEPALARLLHSPRAPALGGEIRTLSVLFADVEGFTGIAERLGPEALVALLNAYFAELTAVIGESGGIVDKFMGDGILAVFGAPLEDPAHAAHAIAAARAATARLAEPAAAARLSALAGTPVRARIGVATGQALVGNIGAPGRFNYTVLGDAVNVAARLEPLNKFYGTRILVSGETVAAADARAGMREVDRVRVFGRDAPITLYEPLPGVGREPSAYEAALAEYRAGRFSAAAQHFASLAATDPAAAEMAARAARLEMNPPGAWDGAIALDKG